MDEVRLQLQAYHEAGHAVAAVVLGTPIRRATISVVTTLVKRGCPQAQRNDALIALAGPLAEDRYCGYSLVQQAQLWGSVWRTDLDNALYRLRAADSLGVAVKKTQQLVRENWRAIERLAQALQQSRRAYRGRDRRGDQVDET